MVYSNCNIDDLSWGTKEIDDASPDLGAAQGSGKAVELELLAEQHDIDAAYNQALDNLRVRKPQVEVVRKSGHQTDQERKDYYVSTDMY